jgi:hypothetical protein
MAQSGYTPILIYGSGTATNVPLAANMTSSASGAELALNYADGKLFYKDSGGTVQVLASKAGNINVSSLSFGTTGLTPSTATTGAITVAGTLITSNGGTGLSSYTAGDLPYYASGTALSKLGIGTSGYILGSSGTAPQWVNSINIGAGTFTSVTDSGLTSGRVTYATTGGLLTDSANLTFNGTQLGVGTASPGATLNVYSGAGLGSIIDSSSASGSYTAYRVQGTNIAWFGAASQVISGASVSDFGITSIGSGAFIFGTGSGAERMRISSAGYLGIGTSSPSTYLTVNNSANSGNTISVTGLTTATGAAEILATRTGTESASQGLSPSITLGNTTASRYSSLAGYQGGFQFFGFNGSSWNEWARIDSSGNLGLGVTPSAWVNGDTIFQIKSGTSYASLWGRNGSLRSITNAYYDGTNYKYTSSSYAPATFQIENTGQFSWSTAPTGTAGNNVTFTQAMTLDNNGNLGIGVTNPATVLSVASSINQQISVDHTGGGQTGIAFYSNTSARYIIGNDISNNGTQNFFLFDAVNSATRLLVDSSGNVGIGTSSPSTYSSYTKLSVLNGVAVGVDASNAGRIIGSTTTGTELSYLTMGGNYNLGSTGEIALVTNTAKSVIFGTNATERMRIDSSGNLLVGVGASGAGFKSRIFWSTASGANGLMLEDGSNSSGTTFLYFVENGTGIGSITRVSTTNAVSYNTTSDRRLKSNITSITNSGAFIDSLLPRNFTWTDANIQDQGFIADEFQQVVPLAVVGEPNATKEEEYEVTPAVKDEQGNITTPAVIGTRTVPVYQSMEASTGAVIANLVAEIQSLRKRILTLENK